jgi:hypothetical protein
MYFINLKNQRKKITCFLKIYYKFYKKKIKRILVIDFFNEDFNGI